MIGGMRMPYTVYMLHVYSVCASCSMNIHCKQKDHNSFRQDCVVIAEFPVITYTCTAILGLL